MSYLKDKAASALDRYLAESSTPVVPTCPSCHAPVSLKEGSEDLRATHQNLQNSLKNFKETLDKLRNIQAQRKGGDSMTCPVCKNCYAKSGEFKKTVK